MREHDDTEDVEQDHQWGEYDGGQGFGFRIDRAEGVENDGQRNEGTVAPE